jgi:hypothetical protein
MFDREPPEFYKPRSDLDIRRHQREVYHSGDEAGWSRKSCVDPTVPARALA